MRTLFVTVMSESDIERQKKTNARHKGAQGRLDAMNDVTPDIQSPGLTKEMGKEQVGEQAEKKRAPSRGNRSRQH
jgi:hypothetical protein